jgi:chromosomal replication initiator protein
MSTTSWDYSVFWYEAMKHIQNDLSEQEYTMWFNGIEYTGSGQEEIQVSVPSSFYRDQVRQRYLSLIEEKLQELSGRKLNLEFQIRQAAPSLEPTARNDSVVLHDDEDPETLQRSSASVEARKPKVPHPQLREEYTFENFVVGHNNSFAANAAIAIAKNPGTGYNPCLIYGGVGLGKTHLIQSIGNSVYQDFGSLKIVYVTMENFTNDFIQSIREKKTQQFKNRYRYADVLLIDDIHFLQKKPETQEELFHTFNALYDSNKQMVFTCDRPVSEIRDLTDRLRSRFERGLNVDLQPPNFETRYAILKKKIEHSGLVIPDEVTDLICNNVTTNVRDLEAALTKLIAYAELVNKSITVDIARQQLKDMFSSPQQAKITIDAIQKTVAEYFNLSSQELKGKKRTKVIAFPRQLAMYICRELTEYSTTEVGLEFGGRDHTTVMYACQRIENRMRTDPTLETTIQTLIRSIKDKITR